MTRAEAMQQAREAMKDDGKIVGIMEAEEIMIRRSGALRDLLAALEQATPAAPLISESAPITSESDEVPCSTHPDAPHGFNRDASHTLDRYVCDCEGWTPPVSCQSAPVSCQSAQAPPAAVPEGYELVRADVVRFLNGSAPLEGVWFGERPDNAIHTYWWRWYLPLAQEQATKGVE